jgi:uncharacterized protein (TIGR03083 family)
MEIEFDNTALQQAFSELRARCMAVGRSITEEQAAVMSPSCPEWSVKDLFAHMVGVAVDIIDGNVDGAATVPWADAQVERRRNDSLATILDEWEGTTDEIDAFITSMGTQIPAPFFIDAWTHEWDVLQALGQSAEPDLTLARYGRDAIVLRVQQKAAEAGNEAVRLVVEDGNQTTEATLGDGEPFETIAMSLFEFMRVTMGRRSRSQIEALGPGADPDVLVIWTPSEHDIADPLP